jgi:two-component system, chemotaxis family, sensor kinase CheA
MSMNDTDNNYEEEIEIITEELESEHDLKVLNDCWHISIRPKKQYEQSIKELLFRQLKTIGRIENRKIISDLVPGSDKPDPVLCYLGFEIDLKCDKTKNVIAGVFSNFRDYFTIRILPPNSNISDYLELIEELSVNNMRIGEILVEIGSLTEMELEEVLNMQNEISDDIIDNKNKKNRPLGELLVSEKIVQELVLKAALEKQEKVRKINNM